MVSSAAAAGKRKSDDDSMQLVKKTMKEKTEGVEKGDIVDVKQLLFTQDRDYLIKHDNQRVQAGQLTGKVIILHFMSLVSFESLTSITSSLVDIYNELSPTGCLEVIFIAVTDETAGFHKPEKRLPTEEERFKQRFSMLPWPAIPLSDLDSRKRLEKRFGLSHDFKYSRGSVSYVIDPMGVVLRRYADYYFIDYGAAGFPFTDKRIDSIISEDKAARKHPSVSTLLSSPQLNYVISNTGEKVSVSDLEDKVVALYFCDGDSVFHLKKIQMAYKKLAKKEENFEIVLIYAYDTYDTNEFQTETSFLKSFSKMPWLALPFKDPRCKKLQRIFHHPNKMVDKDSDPRLAIIGPHGSFIECFGADILFDYGVAAYPFTRESAAKLVAKKAKRLKLGMIWRDPNALFRRRDGSLVTFSQIAGKRTLLLLGNGWFHWYAEFCKMLKERYVEMKGTIDEFEVIHVYNAGKTYSCNEHGAYSPLVRTENACCSKSPWVMHPCCIESPWLMHPCNSNERKLLDSFVGISCGLVGFDSDGRLVKRTESPNIEFPFDDVAAGSLEKDALSDILRRYTWQDFSSDS